MKNIIIPNTNFKCSKFIFGTGSLLNILSKKKRLKLLNTAIDLGFSHFDTSPYYGFGNAELNIGDVLKNNHKITLTSKVCLYPPKKFNHNFCEMLTRKILGKITPNLTKPIIDFTIKTANVSIEQSLRNLKRDYIDILLIHEPIIELINIEEWENWLNKLVKDGKIRYHGLSSLNSSRIQNFINVKKSFFNILQTLDSIDKKEADFLINNNHPIQITHGYMSSTKKRQPNAQYRDIHRKIIDRNPDGAIIISTCKIKHLNEYINLT